MATTTIENMGKFSRGKEDNFKKMTNNSKMANAKGLISENSKEMAVQRSPLKSGDCDENGEMEKFILRC